MKYKSQEVVSLDKAVAELTPNKDTVATWLSAVLEYYIKLTVRCVARPKTHGKGKGKSKGGQSSGKGKSKKKVKRKSSWNKVDLKSNKDQSRW